MRSRGPSTACGRAVKQVVRGGEGGERGEGGDPLRGGVGRRRRRELRRSRMNQAAAEWVEIIEPRTKVRIGWIENCF